MVFILFIYLQSLHLEMKKENVQVGVRNMWQMYVKMHVLSDSFLHFYSPQAGHSPAAPLRVSLYSHASRC